jgi:signal transduction histidine kinase
MRLDVTSDINRDHAHLMGHDRVDRFIVRALWAHFVVVLLLALANAVLQWSLTTPSPFGWRVIGRLEAAAAILIGLAAASIPALSRRWIRTHYDWRIGVTGALTTYSCLLVFLSGGAIEMHFHFFMVMAVLVMYADWRLGWLVLALASVYHGVLNYAAPGWVHAYGRNDVAIIAHGLSGAAMATLTSFLCMIHRRALVEGDRRRRVADALTSVGRSLSETLEVGRIAQQIVDRVRSVLGLRAAELHRVESDSAALAVVATSESAGVEAGSAVASGRGETPMATTQRAVLDLPLQLEGRLIGILRLIDRPGRVFSEAERATAALFADQAALALEAARLCRAQEARTAAETSSRRFRDLVNDLDAIVWEAETNPFRISFISEHAEAILGYPLADWLSDPELLPRHIHPDDRARVMAAFNAANVPAQEQIIEYRALSADGRLRWLRTTLRVGSGTLDGRLRVRGLTVKRRRLEEQVRQGQKLEAIGTLAGGIAHDFNNILAAVIGFSQLALREVGEHAKASGYLSQVLTASNRARELVQQILTFSRPQNQDEAHVALDVNVVAEEVLKLMRAALPSTIEIEANIRAVRAPVLGVASQLHQVLMNLCTNAGHAMHEHGGRLEVGIDVIHVDADLAAQEANLSEGQYVQISVTDTGCGMDRATQERIFEPFFTTKAPGEGTGLGLSVVHGIVRSHRGAIKVYSERGQGTAFHVYFPLFENAARTELVEVEPPRGQGEHVLFVDDEEPLAVMGQAILERLGYRVTGLTSSLAALEVFRRAPERFDVVVTDLTMPKLTGTELASELRRIRPDLPIVLTSGHSVHQDRERARGLGIAELVAKPSTVHALGTAIHRALAQI